MDEIVLNGTWQVRDEPLAAGDGDAARIAAAADGWIGQPVPGDIHQGLIAAGRIAEPLAGLNSFDCAWTEDRSWWFRTSFSVPPDWRGRDVVELELDGLDANASVFLNGIRVGGHESAFFPFTAPVKDLLSASGENVLLVRLTSGVEHVTDADLASLGIPVSTEAANGRPERGDRRRPFVRKPQYSFGWDWSPRVATTAIAGDVRLRAFDGAVLRDVRVLPERRGRGIVLRVAAAAEFFHPFASGEGTVAVRVRDASGAEYAASRAALLRSGITYVDLEVELKNPRLWWPAGMGEQHLYTIEVSLAAGGRESRFASFLYGVRFVELDTGGETFAFRVNGRTVFCKGANWIAPDTIYARASDQTYDLLVREARNANFTMLRVWGGGIYEREAFYRACDRHGILIWQDFAFACAPYPDHLPHFRELVAAEADHQTRRLSRHACVALWSGNNECTQGIGEWWKGKTLRGSILYNRLLPEIVRRNCPETPYWNGSPYGGPTPNSPDVGDRHHWADCTMSPDMEKRIAPEEYDKCSALFVSEYGYIGAPCRETVDSYMGPGEPDRAGEAWRHHTNTFEKETVAAGIRKHYRDPEGLSLDDYILYSGLVQGTMYGYSLDSLRANPRCHGALFWMYADCWGEVGWTIMDYGRRRKPAWYFVRRALSPVRLILRESAGTVRVVMANDTPDTVTGLLEFGRTSLDGADRAVERKTFRCPATSRKTIAAFERGGADPSRNVWFARLAGDACTAPAVLRTGDVRNLRLPEPSLAVSLSRAGGGWNAEIASQTYAHAVRLALPAGATPEDAYFDMLPGEIRSVRVAYAGDLAAAAVGADALR